MSDTPESRRNGQTSGLTYADAGVDIDAGEMLVDAIKPLAKSTRRPGAEASLGGFGALFDLKAAGFEDPLIVATTDGVGTKLKIAIETGRHDHVGIDLVAMCVNDLLAQGAEPLMFLDYFATGKLEIEVALPIGVGHGVDCRWWSVRRSLVAWRPGSRSEPSRLDWVERPRRSAVKSTPTAGPGDTEQREQIVRRGRVRPARRRASWL